MDKDEYSNNGISREEREALRKIRTGRSMGVPFKGPDTHLRATPAARRYAEEKGVDLSQVGGFGPGGRIEKEDIDRYIEQRQIFARQQTLRSKMEPDEAGFMPDETKVIDEVMGGTPTPQAEEETAAAEAAPADAEAAAEGEAQAQTAETDASASAEPETPAEAEAAAEQPQKPALDVSPLAAAMAAAEGIDVAALAPGSGPNGRIMKDDVAAVLEARRAEEEARAAAEKAAREAEEKAAAEEAARLAAQKEAEEAAAREAEEKAAAEKAAKEAEEKAAAEEAARLAAQQEAEAAAAREAEEKAAAQKAEAEAQAARIPGGAMAVTAEIDVTGACERLDRVRRNIKARTGSEPVLSDFVAAALQRTLKDHPAFVRGNAAGNDVLHIGVLPAGSVSHDGDCLTMTVSSASSFTDLVRERHRLTQACSDAVTTPDFILVDLTGCGLWESLQPVTGYATAVLSLGAVSEKERDQGQGAQQRSIVNATLSWDSKMAGLAEGAAFMDSLRAYMDNPSVLLF